MTNICIIPARGGSKRIPNKNIKLFNGKPMISWVIQEALDSNCFNKIIVSTDSEEIKRVALASGAEVPFLRPEYLANDYANTNEVIVHAINKLNNDNIRNPNICCLYPTAPLVFKSDIKEGLKKLLSSQKSIFVFSATTFDYPIQRAIKLDKDGFSSMADKRFLFKRSQDLEERFHDAGQFYWGKSENWLTNESVLEGGNALIIPRWRVQDIDTLEDFERAEIIHKLIKKL